MAVSNLVKNIGAGSLARVLGIVFKLVQVPLFLAYLNAEDYGRWLILYSLPSWMAYANQGFGTVASNEIPMAVAAGDLQQARRHYSTTMAFMLALTAGGLLLALVVAPLVPWHGFLDSVPARDGEIARGLLALVAAMLLSFLSELFYGRFRAGQRAHTYMLLSSLHGWIELLAIVVCFQYTTRFDVLGLGVLAATVVYLLLVGILSYRAFPALTFSRAAVSRADFRELFRKGFAFQAFPLGNALLFQGNLLVVQVILGPAAVALFGTVRTLVRVLNQALELISKSIWPELSHHFGRGDIAAMRRLHRLGLGLSVGLTVVGVAGMIVVGPYLYEFWVGQSLQLSRGLLALFLLPLPFNALWLTSSTVLMASNRHLGLARRYLIATAACTLGCLLLTWLFGLGGAAVSPVIMDLLLIPYVLRHSLLLTEDGLAAAVRGAYTEVTGTARTLLHRLTAPQAL